MDLNARAAVPDDCTYEQERMKLLRRRFKIEAMRAVLDDEARRPRTSIGRTRTHVKGVLDDAAASPPSMCGDRSKAES